MQRLFKITVNGKEYDVAVQELTSGASLMPNYIGTPVSSATSQVASAPKPAAPAVAQAGSGDHCAQMGGVVAGIFVKEGQSVNEGEKILELEAMKMKVPVIATASGKVSRILVAVGDAVTAGQPLLTIS
ncbi:biotin/lipoyl-containing protein [Propionivibrio soli]|uniref:biotin/lipoyl-containing protein n=1 Tax=Propionivibrio soli TaxID=2976531 RepID=UPI0021E77CB3|nr:biotin/lipoyl-containing protein [Propionivibrio soli]